MDSFDRNWRGLQLETLVDLSLKIGGVLSEEELVELVGRYSRPMMDTELGLLGGRLVAQMIKKAGFPSQDSPIPPPPPPATLALCEKDRLIILDGMMKGMTADVIRKADGSIGWLRASGRVNVRQE